MAGGRPKKYDREELLTKLIEWIKLEDSHNINGFCEYAWIPYRTLHDFIRGNTEFSQTYDLVRAIIAKRRELLVSSKLMASNVYALNARTYDRPMNQQWEEEMKFLSDLKKEEVAAVPVKTTEHFESLMSQLDGIQKQSKDLLINLNSSNASS